MDRVSKAHEVPIIRIGDFITLRQQKPNDGWLCSEGLLLDDCLIVKSSDQFENCLWQVHIQGQYSALEEYEEAFTAHKTALQHEKLAVQERFGNELEQPVVRIRHKNMKSKEVLSQLMKAAVNERRLNEKLMQMKIGKAICFGDIIQLRHVKSGKFLTVSDHVLAKQERENLRVSLQSKGSPLSYLVFAPRFKYDKEGQPIYDSSESFIRVHDRQGEYIHGAKKSKASGSNSLTTEVNCSLESTSFTISIYQYYKDISSKSILACQLISFQEPESSGYLTIDRRTPGLSERAKVIVSHQFQLSPSAPSSSSSLSSSSLSSSSSSSSNIGTNLLWLIEKENYTEGGKIILKNHRVTLRDLNSGLYMKQESDRLVVVKDKADATSFEIHNAISSDSSTLQKNSSIQISNNGRWVSQLTVATSEKAKLVLPYNKKYGTDLFIGVQATITLRKFEQLGCRLERPDGHRNPDHISELHRQTKLIFTILQGLKSFLSIASIHTVVEDHNDFEEMLHHSASADMLLKRKVMVREQGLIDVIMDLLELTSKNVFDLTKSPITSPSDITRKAFNTVQQRNHLSVENKLEAINKNMNDSKQDSPTGTNVTITSNNNPISTIIPDTSNSGKVTILTTDEPKPREKRVSLLTKLTDFATQRSNNNIKLSKEDFETSLTFNGQLSPTNMNDGEIRPKSNRPSWKNVFTGGGSSNSGSNSTTNNNNNNNSTTHADTPNGRQFNFHNIPEDEEIDTQQQQPQRQPKMIQPSLTAGVVQSAIKTLGRRASALFSSGLQLSPSLKTHFNLDKNQVQESRPPEENRMEEKSTLSFELCEACLSVLLEAIRDNHINQIIVADRFPLLLNLVKTQSVAVKCIQELLKDNLQILQTKVRQREIDMFVSLLMETEMSVTYLRLLQNACSSPSGVDSTQRMVVLAIFGHLSPLPKVRSKSAFGLVNSESKEVLDLINSSSSSSSSNNSSIYLTLNINVKEYDYLETTWPYASIYFNDDMDTQVRGFNLFSKGLQRISVSWERLDSGEYTMMKVFGSNEPIPLESICSAIKGNRPVPQIRPGELGRLKVGRQSVSVLRPIQKNNTIRRPGGGNGMGMGGNSNGMGGFKMINTVYGSSLQHMNSAQQMIQKKTQVAEYLIQQMYLVADVCLDRNYVAMNILENSFQYETMISILKTYAMPNRIKAPAARIVRCLHLDRHPQEASRYPHLIRLALSNETETGHGLVVLDDTSFRVLHHDSPYRFGILQEVISEYLHTELDTCKCDAYSVEMIRILHSLLQFGFYTSEDQIQDVIGPLIEALDSRRSISSRSELFEETLYSEESNKTIRTKSSVPGFLSHAITWINNTSFVKSLRRRHSNHMATHKVIPLSHESQRISSNRLSRNDSKSSISSRSSLLLIDKKVIKSLSLEFRYIAFIESAVGMGLVLTIVLASVIVVFIQLFQLRDEIGFDIFNYCVTAYFCIDIILRIFCFYRIHDNVIQFYADPFNSLDFILVLVDLALIAVILDINSSVANTGRILRSLRAIRLLRLIRAARLVRNIATSKSKRPWIIPRRYSVLGEAEAKTVVNIIRVLSMIYHRIQNKYVSVIIRAFRIWSEGYDMKNNSKDYRRGLNSYEIYMQLIISEKDITNIIPENFDEVLKDIVMYDDSILVEEALNLLMMHKNHRQLLLNVASQTHMIFTKPFEESFHRASILLRRLKQLIEMFEIWEGLITEEDRNTADEVLSIVNTIQDMLSAANYDTTLAMKYPYLVDDEIQTILRNMDAMSCFMFVLETLYDGGREVPSKPVVNIMTTVIQVICWFVKNCPKNQVEAFKYFDWFVERIDDNINSGKALREILRGNRELIKQCPRTHIADFAKKIVTKGHRPEYLDMFVGMTEMNDSNFSVPTVETEIAKFLTGREWKHHILLWCSSPNSTEYLQRREAMEKYSNITEVDDDVEENLPSDLLYHVKLLTILTGCNLGPKLQAIYSTDDILYALLDPATILPVKKGLANLLIGSIQSGLDRVRYCEYLWKFLDVTLVFFDTCVSDLSMFLKSDHISTQQIIDRGDWLELCISIISTVFQDFDLMNFSDLSSSDDDFKYSRRSEHDIKSTVRKLFMTLRNLLETHESILGSVIRDDIVIALSNLSQHCDSLPVEVESYEYNAFDVKRRRTLVRKQSLLKGSDDDEIKYRAMYRKFIQNLKDSMEKTDLSNESILMFESIPSKFDNLSSSDTRIEPLVKKITSHIRTRLQTSGLSRSIHPDSVNITIWILQTFRQLIEKYLNYTIRTTSLPDILSTQSENENTKLQYYRKIFNDNGVVYLCMDLISVGIDHILCTEAMKLLVALLMKSGGCQPIQQSAYNYLKESDSILFFDYLKDTIDNINLWVVTEIEKYDIEHVYGNSNGNVSNNDNNYDYDNDNTSQYSTKRQKKEKELPDLIMFFLLQLMCEGEFSGIKNFVREQSKNSRLVNIFDAISSLIDFLSRNDRPDCYAISITALKTVQKLLSGPCKGNQDQLILHTELLVSLNRFMRLSRPHITQSTASNFQSLFMSISGFNQRDKPSQKTMASSSVRMNSNYHSNNNGNSDSNHNTTLTSVMGTIVTAMGMTSLKNSSYVPDRVNLLETLKETVIDVLRAAIEGQPKTSVVFERVTTTIEFNVLNLLLLPPETKQTIVRNNLLKEYDSRNLSSSNTFRLSSLQSKYLVFVETLGHLRSNLPEVAQDKITKEIVCIEVVWKNEVHKVHFHVLDLCRELSEVSKTQITKDIDSMSQELKLKEFAKRSRNLFKEAEHQHYLQSIGLSNLWGIKTHLTWIMFCNAFVMNVLLLGFFGTGVPGDSHSAISSAAISDNNHYMRPARELSGQDDHVSGLYLTGDEPTYFDPTAGTALLSLNILHIVMAAITVVLIIIGQMPVTYAIHMDSGKSVIESILATATEPLPVWYLVYLLVSIWGIVYSRLWLTGLLLDWVVLDSTTSYVLLAVRYPARQLLATLIIILIFVNIFSAIYFYFYRGNVQNFNIFDLWESFKLSMSYGIRGEYGVSHEMSYTLGNRMVVDIAFYFIILAILRHIFFAIIVDTFGKLRELKFERDMEANNMCFICGVERHDYDKLSHAGNSFSFSDHRGITHYPLNYLYYMMHIWKQPQEDDNGIEIHVRKCLASGNVSWFPIGIVTDTRIDDNLNLNTKKFDPMFDSNQWDQDNYRMAPLHPSTMRRNDSISMPSPSNSNDDSYGGHGSSPRGNGGVAYQQIRSSSSSTEIGATSPGQETVMVERLNAIQRQLSNLSDTMGNSRSSVLASRQQTVLYNNNTFDRDRQNNDRFRMTNIFPRITEEVGDGDEENADDDDDDDGGGGNWVRNGSRIESEYDSNSILPFTSPFSSSQQTFNPTYSYPSQVGFGYDMMNSMNTVNQGGIEIVNSGGSGVNNNNRSSSSSSSIDEVMKAIGSLSKSVQEISTRLKVIEDVKNSTPIKSTDTSVMSPSVVVADILNTPSLDTIKLQSKPKLMTQISTPSIKSVEGSEDDDSIETSVPPEVVQAKIEAMRSNPNLFRDYRNRTPNLSAQSSTTNLLTLSRPATMRQQQRESTLGPSRELIGNSSPNKSIDTKSFESKLQS